MLRMGWNVDTPPLGCESIVSGSTTLYSASLSNASGQCSGFTGNGYSGNGNVVSSQDSVNGNLTYTYDDFNRLVGAVGVSGPWAGKTFAWTYDRFGNRWSQAITGQTTQSYQFTQGNHHINGYSYDAAGNLLNDGVNGYLYDDENRVAAVNMQSGGQLLYSYDAAGQRIRKSNGGTIDEYVYDPSGREIGDMTPLGALNRVEIYAGGRHLVTYDGNSNAAYFVHSDWQGTERVRSLYNGTSFETCKNQPFGDGQTCTSLGADISPMHYTGKPRDTETNLDYFGARYYSSGMARWMSPDWADKPTTVPYANFSDPQSLNLYGYVNNNPVTKVDDDGHMMSLQQEQASWGGGESSAPYNAMPSPSGYSWSIDPQYNRNGTSTTPDPAVSPRINNGATDSTNKNSKIPDRAVIESHTPSPNGASNLYIYQLTNASGKELKGDGYSVEEHIQSIDTIGNVNLASHTSENSFIDLANGKIPDLVGLSTALPEGDHYFNLSLQSFTVKFHHKDYELSTEFVHIISASGGKVNTAAVGVVVP